MNIQHFLRKGDKDNEEVYQIFGSLFKSKNNQHTSPFQSLNSDSLPKTTSSVNQSQEDNTISSNENESNSTKDYFDNKEREEERENRFCHIILECDSKGNMKEKGKRKVGKEIEIDYFKLALLSRKFQQKKQFCNFPFIKRFKFDIKSIKEDTFLEFIKSTQGEEFMITETNYYELYHLSKEWGTYELTSILIDYGKRHESDIRLIIEQYNYLEKKYDYRKEKNIRKQYFKKKEKDHKTVIEGKNEEIGRQKIIFKNKFSEIKMVEEKMINQIEDCFRTNTFWEIGIDTIHRLIKETSKQDYSHDLLFERIIESIEERGKLIEMIDPCLLSEAYHQKLIDLQYNLVNELKNNKQSNQQNNNSYINMNLIFELLQSYQECDYNEHNIFRNKFNLEEINKMKKELEEKEKDIEQKRKELKELREREMNFCNEIKKVKEKLKEEEEKNKRKERELKFWESEIKTNQKEVKNKKIENCRREEENLRREEENLRREEENLQREEENKRNEEKVEKKSEEVEKGEKEIQEREEKVEREKDIIENKEKEIIRNKKENEIKKEEIKKNEENIIEKEKNLEENKSIFEKEKISLDNNMREEKEKMREEMREEREKMREKEKQQQKLIDELQNQVKQMKTEISQMRQTDIKKTQHPQATDSEMKTFLRENNLYSIDYRDRNDNEAIHIACRNGNDKIVSYILSKNPSKLNVKTVFFILINVLLFLIFIVFFTI